MVNNIYQLTNELRTGGTAYQRAWTYDKVGNRQWQIKNGVRTDYTCNDANQMVQEVTGSVTINTVFDANGNMTQKSDGTYTGIFGYDFENRQISLDATGTTNDATYGYDALGRRVSKTVAGVTEKYLLDGANVIADYDGAGTLLASYVTPLLDDNLLMARNGNTYYFFHDGLGSVRSLIRSDQNVFDKYDYYAFGEMLSETGGVTNRYKFTGREWDGESSTYYYRARYYNPSVGRFNRRDPIGYLAGLNLYSYVRNNSINSGDPFGLWDWNTPGMEAGSSAPSSLTTEKKCDHKANTGDGGKQAEAPKLICGPDITEKLKKTIENVENTFYKLGGAEQSSLCIDMMFPAGWDITGLNFTNNYQFNNTNYPGCCTPPDCTATVSVNGQCFYAGSVNYVIFGVMTRLCRYDLSFADFRVWLWKTFRGATNTSSSIDWTRAGYVGWGREGATTPSGDRPQCKTPCPQKIDSTPWDVRFGRVLIDSQGKVSPIKN